MNEEPITLEEHIINEERIHPEATGDFTGILLAIAEASRRVRHKIVNAGLLDILGSANELNIHQEDVQKMDLYANNALTSTLAKRKAVGAIASEELMDIIPANENGKYAVALDPLDGSSNIDVNMPVGTIFSVLKRPVAGKQAEEADFFQQGKDILAAGYVLYGSSTVMVYSAGHGAHSFIFLPDYGDFYFQQKVITPEFGKTYSTNEAYSESWSKGVKDYIDNLKDPKNKVGYSSRYVGTLVADVHRNLLKGGIYFYPGDKKNPQGKLRLIYECVPLSFLVEQAGGMAIDDKGERILDLTPTAIHQRSSLILGSRKNVEEAKAYLAR